MLPHSFFRVSLAALLTTLAAVAASVAPAAPGTAQLHARLSELSEALRWRGTTHSTYAAVEPAAQAAHSALVSLDAGAVPHADDFADALARLVAESRFLTELSRPRNYTPGFLDSAGLLTASVNEWHHAIGLMSAGLTRPSSYRAPPPLSKVGRDAITKATEPGTEFRDWDDGPTMVVIPTGSYTAGASDDDLEAWAVPADERDFERPQRRVQIATPLAFSRTEVTVAQFEAFVRESGYEPRGGARWFDPADPGLMVFNPGLGFRDPGFPQTPASPVVAITRKDAQAYARWLSAATGHAYRLPTEDEWEWAARGGTNTTFFWGDDARLELASLYANTYDQTSRAVNGFVWPANNGTDGFAYTAPVASFRPNAFGLYDMTANAREFVADSWVEKLGPETADDGSVRRGAAPFPVLRGAAWNYMPRNLRISYRDGYYSSEVASNMFGIRLVRELQ